MAQRQTKKSTRQFGEVGRAVVSSTFNNTIITITDGEGNTVSWSSSGSVGFKGSRKSTPYAASLAATEAGKKAGERGVKKVSVCVKGPGSGRDAAVKGLRGAGLAILSLSDITPIPHNGCRAKNPRRV